MKPKTPFAVGGIISIFCSLSIVFVRGYRYGVGDHDFFIPFVKNIVHPELYPHDLLIEQRQYYYSFLWHAVAWLYQTSGMQLSRVFFVLHALNTFGTFLAVYLIAYAFSKKREVAFLSLFLLLFYEGSLASTAVLENTLIPRSVAITVLLFSFHAFLTERYAFAAVLLGLAFNAHPLTATYALLMMLAAVAVLFREIEGKTLLKSLCLFLVTASPVLIWKLLHSPPSSTLLYADPNWMNVLRLRVPHHHFPFLWSPRLFIQAALRAGVFVVCWKHIPESRMHRAVVAFAAATAIMMLAGIVFVEWLPVSIVVQLQFFRSFSLILFFVLIYYANFLVAEMDQQSSFVRKLVAALVSVGLFLVFQPALRTFIFLAVVAYMFARTFAGKFLGERAVETFSISALLILAIFFSLPVYFMARDTSDMDSSRDSRVGMQKWLKKNTTIDDLLIVPPGIWGMRIESERSVYADWKDGGLAPLNPAFAVEWLRRMRMLGVTSEKQLNRGYRNLKESDFVKIAREVDAPATFLLTDRNIRLNFPSIYQDNQFRVYWIVTQEPAPKIP